jgi:hypothetical protein
LQLREKKQEKQFLHEIHSHLKISKDIEDKNNKIQEKMEEKEVKEKKWKDEAN